MGTLITFLATMLGEALKATGDTKGLRHVDAILKGRPKLPEAETALFKSALARLGRRPA